MPRRRQNRDLFTGRKGMTTLPIMHYPNLGKNYQYYGKTISIVVFWTFMPMFL